MDINMVGLTIYSGNTAVGNGSYRINGNTITIKVFNATGAASSINGKTYAYTIVSDTSFTGGGETWYRR
jgi:lipopolysaccharide export system protein LptA